MFQWHFKHLGLDNELASSDCLEFTAPFTHCLEECTGCSLVCGARSSVRLSYRCETISCRAGWKDYHASTLSDLYISVFYMV